MKKILANLSAPFRNWRRAGEKINGVRPIPDPLEQFIVMRHAPHSAGTMPRVLPLAPNLLPR
jgi:hypothetical protein